MAYSQVQKKVYQSSASSLTHTVTLVSAPTIGNTLILFVGSDEKPLSIPLGGTWAELANVANFSGMAVYAKIAGASEPSSVTFTLPNSNSCVMHLYEYSGLVKNGIFDVSITTTGQGVSTSVSCGTTPMINMANELAFACICLGTNPSANTSAWSNSFVEADNGISTASTNNIRLVTANKLITTQAQLSTTATLTATGNSNEEGLIVTFRTDPNQTATPSTSFLPWRFPADGPNNGINAERESRELLEDISVPKTYGNKTWSVIASTKFFSSGTIFVDSVTEAVTANDSITGTGVFSGIVSEPVTASDTDSAIATYNVSVSESVSASDSPSAIAIFNVGTTEAVSANDSDVGNYTTPASITESVTSNTTQDRVAIFPATIIEAVTSGDTDSAIANYNVSLSEVVSASDTPSAIANHPASVTEAISSGDTETALALYNASITEPVTASDNTSANAIYRVSVTEAVSAADQSGFTGSTSDSVTEAISADSTQTATRVTPASIVEAVTSSDTTSASSIINITQVESVSANDLVTATVVYHVSVIEAVSAVDHPSTISIGGSLKYWNGTTWSAITGLNIYLH